MKVEIWMPALYRMKWAHEVGATGQTKRPAVVYLIPNHFTELTSSLQWFWFSLNGAFEKDPTAQKWRGYTNGRAFITDTQGTEKYRDFISGRNLKKGPSKIKCLVCRGNVLTGQVTGSNLIPKPIDGKKGPPWGISYESHPWLIHHATNNARGEVVNPFTHFGGRITGVPVFYPFIGTKQVKIPLKLLQRLEVGEDIPSPYCPPMETEKG